MIDVRYYRNIAEIMGINKPLPRPKPRCSLHDNRAESIEQLGILTITVKDCDYYDRNEFEKYNPY